LYGTTCELFCKGYKNFLNLIFNKKEYSYSLIKKERLERDKRKKEGIFEIEKGKNGKGVTFSPTLYEKYEYGGKFTKKIRKIKTKKLRKTNKMRKMKHKKSKKRQNKSYRKK
jgi:hypothetical protein